MIKKTTYAALLLFAAPSYGQPSEIACYWDAPSSHVSGGAGEAAKFYGKASEQAYFRVDVDAGTVTHNDPYNSQSIVFPYLKISSAGGAVKITAASPNIKGLKNIPSAIEISIDRYTLESTMVLVMPTSDSKMMAAKWLRFGRCYQRKL